MAGNEEVRIGCCGFGGSQKEYFRLFRLVEIQQTFYQLPQVRTAEKWRSDAPPGFVFTMKAWQLITHEPSSPTYRRLREGIDPDKRERYGSFKSTREVQEAWRRTSEFAGLLGARVIVFQCPASFRCTPENESRLRDFFGGIDRGGFILAWEPRGPWPEDTVRGLCRDLDLVHCVDPFKNSSVHGEPFYYRLHGITGTHYRFTDGDLQILRSAVRNGTGYILFNNSPMKEDALRFMRLLAGDGKNGG